MASLETLIDRVAGATMSRDMENEDWEKAVAIHGLLATGDEAHRAHANDLIDRAVATQTSEGLFSYGSLDAKAWTDWTDYDEFQSIVDPVALGYGVLDRYEATGEDRYLNAARAQYEYLRDEAPRTADGGISHNRHAVELWIDSLYMLCPFLARYGAVADAPEAAKEAIRQLRVHERHLYDERTSLFRHEWRETPNTYPDASFWLRGNGWALAALLAILAHLPDADSERAYVEEVFVDLSTSLLAYQDRSGFWHHIVDDRGTSLEASGTLMLAYAYRVGVDRGLLPEKCERAGHRAMEVCAGVVDDDGRVRRVAKPPGGPNTPLGVTSFGQGWFLLAASRWRDYL